MTACKAHLAAYEAQEASATNVTINDLREQIETLKADNAAQSDRIDKLEKWAADAKRVFMSGFPDF
jgi:hypothetical protein